MMLFSVGFAAFAGLVLALLVLLDRQRRRHVARLMRVRSEPEARLTGPQRAPRDRRDVNGPWARIERELDRTTLRTSVPELAVQLAIGCLALYALAVLIGGVNPLLALPVALIVPLALAALVIRVAQDRYLRAFTADLPEALDVFARGLRAGRPITDSLSIVVDTAKGAVRAEFTRCHDEIRMGTALPDSLARLERRVPTPEVSFFAVATSLQVETGGNLIETMESLAAQLRERRKLRRKARALTSEARASAAILASLPFAVALLLATLNWSYLAPLALDPRGQVMSAAAVTSVGLGVFIMARMGKLDA